MQAKLFFLMLLAATSGAMAQTAAPNSAAPAARPPAQPAARGPALELAIEAARIAVDTCKARDQKIGVSVVDSAGVLKTLLASDGASSRGVSSSTAKAVTALSFKAATSQLAEQIKTDTALAEKISANTAYNARAGGVLLKVGDEIIGAVGVGGARGSDVDEACAVAGIQAIQSRLN